MQEYNSACGSLVGFKKSVVCVFEWGWCLCSFWVLYVFYSNFGDCGRWI